jgi:RsiW-degrading membrane proteinase PrsW (M82 family)
MVLAAIIYIALRLAGFHRLFSNDAEGIGALLQIIGTLYSVVYAFAIYVIWGQFAAVENEILKESGALKDLILFSKGLKEATRDPMVRAVRAYARGVMESEWGTLSRGEDTERTDKLFSAIISSVTDAKPENDAEFRVHERLLEIANQASAHRDERLAISTKRIPRTLLLFVMLTALAILFLLFFFPFHNLALGTMSIALATMLLFFAHFVLTDLDNPFEGTWNVSNRPFEELIAKAR